MSSKNLKMFFYTGSFLLLQACAGNSVTNNDNENFYIKMATPVSVGQKLADKLGAVEIDDVVKDINNKQQVVFEHKVLSEYTAATGRLCRKIESKQVYSEEVTSGIVCKNTSLQWFWPRQFVY